MKNTNEIIALQDMVKEKMKALKDNEFNVKVWDLENEEIDGIYSIYNLPSYIGHTYPNQETRRFERTFIVLPSVGFFDFQNNELFDGDILYSEEKADYFVVLKNEDGKITANPLTTSAKYSLEDGDGKLVGNIYQMKSIGIKSLREAK